VESLQYRVLNREGQEVGSFDLDPAVFGESIRTSVVHDTIVWQRNRKRAGTHSCLSKGEMKGGGRKPWRQKGTGRARCGSNTSPVWVGGAVAHGPKPHSYETRVARRTRRQALLAALSDKVKSQHLVICEDWEAEQGKSKLVRQALNALGVAGSSTLLVVPPCTKGAKTLTLSRAARNIDGVLVAEPAGVNVYDLLRCRYLVSSVEGMRALQDCIRLRLQSTKEASHG